MDRPEALSDMPPEEIRSHIAATREALGHKLVALTDKVAEARASVQAKIDNVREQFSLSHHVRQNPGPAFFAAVCIGIVIGHQGPRRFRPATVAAQPGRG